MIHRLYPGFFNDVMLYHSEFDSQRRSRVQPGRNSDRCDNSLHSGITAIPLYADAAQRANLPDADTALGFVRQEIKTPTFS